MAWEWWALGRHESQLSSCHPTGSPAAASAHHAASACRAADLWRGPRRSCSQLCSRPGAKCKLIDRCESCKKPNAPNVLAGLDEFKKVLVARSSSTGTLRGMEQALGDVARRHKIRLMIFCLAEAKRQTERQFLSNCKCVAIHQDGRKGRLLIRYCAVGANLEVRRGCLGHVRSYGSSNEDIARGTERILRSFATSFSGAPAGSCCEEKYDQSLNDHLRFKVEILNADAASDEQLAARCMRKTSLLQTTAALFPNAKICLKDPAHASRRTMLTLNISSRFSTAFFCTPFLSFMSGSPADHGWQTPSSRISWKRWCSATEAWPTKSSTAHCSRTSCKSTLSCALRHQFLARGLDKPSCYCETFEHVAHV